MYRSSFCGCAQRSCDQQVQKGRAQSHTVQCAATLNMFRVGQRVQVDDALATVRYTGEILNTSGLWLGVEWDAPQRGKHDGLHEGVRYFHCNVPNSGSFIRPNPAKVLTGRSILDVLIERYKPTMSGAAAAADDDDTAGYSAEQDVGIVHFGGDRSIEVEMVGFEKIERKQKHLDRLHEAGLTLTQVANAGAPGEIKRISPHIQDLNLSKNLIADWSIIAEITSQLEELETLRLSYTRFNPLSDPPPPNFGLSFANLRSLALNYARMSWHEAQRLEPAMPLLENLQLAGNQIKVLGGGEEAQGAVRGFKNLKWLNLEENELEIWEEVAKLRELESLDVLYLNDNSLTSINDTSGFRALRFLQLNNNKLADWASIDHLNALPALREIRCKANPVFKDMESERQTTMLLGRIKGLTKINGNTILPKDRRDMERYYLSLTTRDGTTEEEIEKLHPRYRELSEIHGAPTLGLASKDVGSTLLKDRLIELKITSRNAIDGDPIKTVSKKFLGTLTIRNLQNILARLLAIPMAQQKLYCRQMNEDANGVTAPEVIELKDELKELSFYDVQSGDEIIVVKS